MSAAPKRIYSCFITGRRINSVSLHAEAWFWRILAIANKHGRVTADIAALAAQTSGNRKVRLTHVARWVCEMLNTGLIEIVDGSFHVVDFERFQPQAVLNGCRASIPEAIRRDVLLAGCCKFCGLTTHLTVDHIRPVSKGGGDERSNLQCLCLPCNLRKSNKWEGEA
jgi:hypothetical protein